MIHEKRMRATSKTAVSVYQPLNYPSTPYTSKPCSSFQNKMIDLSNTMIDKKKKSRDERKASGTPYINNSWSN